MISPRTQCLALIALAYACAATTLAALTAALAAWATCPPRSTAAMWVFLGVFGALAVVSCWPARRVLAEAERCWDRPAMSGTVADIPLTSEDVPDIEGAGQ